MSRESRPSDFEEAGAALAAASAADEVVRITGGATKIGWGRDTGEPDVVLGTSRLDRIVEHNHGDLTAVLQAGTPVATAQELFLKQGQMLALDPPLGADAQRHATIGGVLATADSGPLRHRYGAPRDLVLGMTVALSDGTIARSGGKVIKNVAGYDIAKLFCGSFGTLGLILEVSVRLHPVPAVLASAVGTSGEPERVSDAARALASAPFELEALDVAWRGGRGGLLARIGGVEAQRRAQRVGALMRESGLEQVEIVADDDELWARQRAGQRSSKALVRVAARPTELAAVLRAADGCEATVVGRAALGMSYIDLEPAALGELHARLPPAATSVLLDAPAQLRQESDPWAVGEGPALALMRRIKARFDPAGACNRGMFVGGI